MLEYILKKCLGMKVGIIFFSWLQSGKILGNLYGGGGNFIGCLEILKRNNSLAVYIYVGVFVWNILFHSKLQLLVSPCVTHSQLFFCPN